MEDFKFVILCVAYFSLLVELVFFPVPSVASTYQLVLVDKTHKRTKSRLNTIKDWPIWKKLLILFIPVLINVTVFLLPFFFSLNIIEWDMILNQHFFTALGVIFLLSGRSMTFFSVIQIKKINKSIDHQKYLHQKGWFRWSRNPGLLGMYIFILGVWLLYSQLLFLVGIIFYIFFMHFKILLEEEYLMEKFGEKYQQYLKQTRRYL